MSKLTILAKMFSHCRPWFIPFGDKMGWLTTSREYEVTYKGSRWRARGGVGDFAVLNEMFLHGSYDAALRTLESGATVIDIGANIGAFSIAAARHGATVVWAFEPVPANVALLRKNIKRNDCDEVIRVEPNAIAGKEGTLSLFVRETDAGGGTLHPEIHRSWHDKKGAIAPDIRKIEIKCISLEQLFLDRGISRCSLLKLDCEGAEFEILMSLSPGTAKLIDAVVFEYHSDGKLDEIVARLKQLGFNETPRHPTYQVVFMTRHELMTKRACEDV